MAEIYTGQSIKLESYPKPCTITYEFVGDQGTLTGSIATNVTSDSYTWTPLTSTFAPYMINSDYGTLKITCTKTKDNGDTTSMMSTYKLIVDSTVTPSVYDKSITKSKAFNYKSITGVTEITLKFSVKNLYNAKQTVTISQGDRVVQRKIIDGASGNSNGTNVTYNVPVGVQIDLGTAGYTDCVYDVTVTDSRGRSTSTTLEYRLYEYISPVINCSAERGDNGEIILTFSETHLATVAEKSNPLTQFICRIGDTDIDLSDKTSPYTLPGTYDLSRAYNLGVIVEDTVISTISTLPPSSKYIIAESNSPIIDIGKDGNTVAFFNTAPTASNSKTVRIHKDPDRYAQIGPTGIDMIAGTMREVHIGRKTNNTNEYFYMFSPGNYEENPDDSYGNGSFTVGSGKASGEYAVVMGCTVNATGERSCAFGSSNTASGYASFVEGHSNEATGDYSHAEGYDTSATGRASHASGYGTIASGKDQTVVGRYNVSDTSSKYVFIAGNGGSDSSRKNAFGVTANGNVEILGNIYMQSGQAIYKKDTDGNDRELLSFNGSGLIELGYGSYQHGTRKTRVSGGNELTLRLKNPSVEWKPYFTKGDSITATFGTAGYITNSGKDVTYIIPLGRPIVGSPTITVESVNGLTVRQNDKYLYGSTSSSNVKPSKFTAVSTLGGSAIRVIATMANTTNVTNNSPCGIWSDIKITFS